MPADSRSTAERREQSVLSTIIAREQDLVIDHTTSNHPSSFISNMDSPMMLNESQTLLNAQISFLVSFLRAFTCYD